MYSTKRLRLLLIRLSWPIFYSVLAALVVGFLLFFRLPSLVPGFSASEVAVRASAFSVHTIIKNPLNAPYKAALLCLLKLHHHGALAMRGISALIGVLIVALFYYVLSHWYTRRVALLGSALLVSSSWFLHYARLADPGILYGLPVIALAYGTWLRITKRSGLALFVGAALMALLMYIPGLVCLLVAGGVWQSRALYQHLKRQPLLGVLAFLFGFTLLLPLGYGLLLHPSLLRTFVGLPAHTWPTPLSILKNIGSLPYQFIIRGHVNPVVNLSNLPILDIFTLAMASLGVYAFYFQRRLHRAQLLFGASIVGIVLVALGGPVTTVILLPFVYIFAAGGMSLMLQQWFTVFPRNPLAAIIATTLLSIAVVITGFYHVNRYFIAWPNAPATKQTFYQKP